MSELNKYELTVSVTDIDGSQTFACEAKDVNEAMEIFKRGGCEIIDVQIEVIGLEDEPHAIEESSDISSRIYQDVIASVENENQRLTTDRKNAISLMSKSWQHDSESQDDLMTRYVTMAENQFKKKNEEIDRLTAIATKHATRCDELYEALESTNQELYFLINELNKYKTKDARCDQIDPPDLHDMETCHINAKLLDKSRTEADK